MRSPTPSRRNKLVAVSVLSGNRNFEGRVHPNVRANYLACPPLVVAYALLGNIREDITTAPLGTGKDGKPVYLKDIWPTNKEIDDTVARQSSPARCSWSATRDVFKGPKQWQAIEVTGGTDTYTWHVGSTYVKNPPYFEGITHGAAPVADITGARVLALLGDSITTDHISPAGNIKKIVAGRRLPQRSTRCCRRTSTPTARAAAIDDVMVRGTFANIRIKNEMLAGVEGGMTKHFPGGEEHVDLRRRRCATRRKACRWSCSAARNTAPAPRATGPPRAPCCWA